MLHGLWTRREPTTSKKHRKAYYYIQLCRGQQQPFTEPLHSPLTYCWWIPGPWFNPSSSTRKYKSRKIEMTLVLFFPRSSVMQMREALWFVPVSKFRGIYANVKQNGWSELVIHESSKENESLDTATSTRLLPAFWMTSCLFISLDFLPPYTFLSPAFLS